jgi:hypothetical protein
VSVGLAASPITTADSATLGGDFAGAVYSPDGCPGDCVDTVNNDPSSFVDAFWDLAAVRTYE